MRVGTMMKPPPRPSMASRNPANNPNKINIIKYNQVVDENLNQSEKSHLSPSKALSRDLLGFDELVELSCAGILLEMLSDGL